MRSTHDVSFVMSDAIQQNAQVDAGDDEHEDEGIHGIRARSASAPCVWSDHTINVV